MSRKKPIPFSIEVFTEVCNRIAEGRSLRSVCKDEGMPSTSGFMEWVKRDVALTEQYARAMEDRAEALFEETKEIADSATPETVNVARLQVDTRKWFLGKLDSKKYGDRSQVDHTNNGKEFQAQTVIIQSTGEAPEKT